MVEILKYIVNGEKYGGNIEKYIVNSEKYGGNIEIYGKW